MRRRALAVCGGFLSLGMGCADILGIDDGIPRTDAAAPDAAADATSDVADAAKPACDLTRPFGAPVAITELDTMAAEQHARLSPDELDVTFQRTVVDAGWDLFHASRASATSTFAGVAPITELDTPYDESDLTESPDGLRAYFASDRPGGLGGYDIWQASRDAAAAPFELIAPVGNVSSTSTDHDSYYVPGALYLVSDRGTGGDDIYRASEQSGGFAAPLLVVELASPVADGYPVVTTDELTIYFASTRGDAGAFEVYVATRATSAAPWSTPALVPELEGFGNALPGWISPDGCRLYLSSDKSGNFDLYVATKP